VFMLPAEKRAQVIAALGENSNAMQVVREIGDVDPTTVRRIARAAGIELTDGQARKGHHRVPTKKRTQIAAALKDNPNAAQVSRKIGSVSRMTVWKIAKAAGISLHGARETRALADLGE
jgi:hypothetical protein